MHLNRKLLSYLLPVFAVGIVVWGCEHVRQESMQVCEHPYALCTSAMCVPQPSDPSKAICICDVVEGRSMATIACSDLKPITEAGIQIIYSTFSFEQFRKGKLAMKCPHGTPWTWCLNKRCTVDPENPTKANCICDVVQTGEWMTLGGDCDVSTCKTGHWSGASIHDFEQTNVFMTQAQNLEASPAKWCPVAL